VALPLNSGRVRLITICLHVPPPSLSTAILADGFLQERKQEKKYGKILKLTADQFST